MFGELMIGYKESLSINNLLILNVIAHGHVRKL